MEFINVSNNSVFLFRIQFQLKLYSEEKHTVIWNINEFHDIQ